MSALSSFLPPSTRYGIHFLCSPRLRDVCGLFSFANNARLANLAMLLPKRQLFVRHVSTQSSLITLDDFAPRKLKMHCAQSPTKKTCVPSSQPGHRENDCEEDEKYTSLINRLVGKESDIPNFFCSSTQAT